MSAKLDQLTVIITKLHAQQVALQEQLLPLYVMAQREQLRETSTWACAALPQLAQISYLFEDGRLGCVDQLLDAAGSEVAGWQSVVCPDGQPLEDAFPLIDAATPLDDVLVPGQPWTWERALLDAHATTRIPA